MSVFSFFLPSNINGYQLIPVKLLIISFSKTNILAIQTSFKGYKYIIENIFSENIECSTNSNDKKALINAFSNILSKANYTNIVIIDSCDSILLKFIQLPFLDKEKIKMILRYEAEQLFPFNFDNAFYDYSIVNTDNQQSNICVAALIKNNVENYLNDLNFLKKDLMAVSISVFDYLSFIKKYATKSQVSIFIAMCDEVTYMFLFNYGIVCQIRILNKNAIFNLNELLNDISSTLNLFKDLSFVSQIDEVNLINSSSIKDDLIINEYQNYSTSKIILFDFFNKTKNLISVTASAQINAIYLPCIMTGFAIFNDDSSNLAYETTDKLQQKNLKKSILITFFLSFFSLSLMIIHLFLQSNILKESEKQVKDKMLFELKKVFPSILGSNVKEAINKATKEVEKEEKVWAAFSNTQKSFLSTFSTISAAIDREGLGLILRKCAFIKNSVILEGKVKSFDALEQLERQLRETDLFETVPDLQKVEFSVTLFLKMKEIK